jgi:PAS domain S-box-containing protein
MNEATKKATAAGHEPPAMTPLASGASPASTGISPDYRHLFELNPHPMWIFDVQTLDFLDVNEAASRHYGYSRHEFLELTLRDIRPSEDIPRLARRVSVTRDEPTTSATLWRHRKKDGTLIDVEVTSFRVTFMNRPARVVTISDVSKRLRAENTIRDLLQTVTRAQEEERIRIARELHDDTAQSLSLLLLGLRKVAEAETLEAARGCARELRAHIARAIGEVRRIARGLRPADLDALGLAEALRRLAVELCNDHDIEVDVAVSGLDRPLPPPIEIALYRIAQEALTNAWKHAAASTISIVARRNDASVRLIVEDDGLGFSVDSPPRNQKLGLQGIRERAMLLGGELAIESSPGKGTTLYVSVPLSEAQR